MKRPQIKIETDRKRDGWVYHRVATSSEWASYAYPLGVGEVGYDSSTNTLKMGDGVSLWASLPSISGGTSSGDGSFLMDDGDPSGGGTGFIIDDGVVV